MMAPAEDYDSTATDGRDTSASINTYYCNTRELSDYEWLAMLDKKPPTLKELVEMKNPVIINNRRMKTIGFPLNMNKPSRSMAFRRQHR